jgi:RNA polymerase sigma factor (sigma-70 family)
MGDTMTSRALGTLLEQLRRTVGLPGSEISDVDLLQRFAEHHDEVAFTALVERFGPMVLAVCRRVIRDSHAAEDAFQATFLVLARKAPSLLHQELVGNWLWGVAYRTARHARADAVRWHNHKREIKTAMAPDPVEEVMWRDLRPVLDEEIYRLPAKYRQPFVLCYFEGKTNEEAARELGCPPGTVFTRLARAREILRRRLTRRGVALSSAALALAITHEATARVPSSLASLTIKAATLFAAGNTAAGLTASTHALTLAHGALKAMPVGKSFALAAALCTITTLGGAGLLRAHRERADSAPEVQSVDAPAAAIRQEAAHLAPPLKQESQPSRPVDAKKTEARRNDPDTVQETKHFGFGRGFGISRDSAAAAATFNSAEARGRVNVTVTGSRKLAVLALPAVQRELLLSDQQYKQVRDLQKKQNRALQDVSPREPTDARDAARVLQEVERAAKNVKTLVKEIDQTIDELLTDKQRRQFGKLMPTH